MTTEERLARIEQAIANLTARTAALEAWQRQRQEAADAATRALAPLHRNSPLPGEAGPA